MAFSVQMPALGESVTEGTVTRWLKQEGEPVRAGSMSESGLIKNDDFKRRHPHVSTHRKGA